MWRSLRRFLIAVLVIGTLIFCFALRAGIVATSSIFAMTGLALTFPSHDWLRFFSIIVSLIVFWQFATFGSLFSQSPWLLRIASSPLGYPSCTSARNVELPYNANAYYQYTDESSIYVAHSYCPHPDFRWADATATLGFPGTSAQIILEGRWRECFVDCVLASPYPQDYAVNPGRGLTNGWTLTAPTSDTALCPLVAREINSAGVVGTGEMIAATCSFAFAEVGLIPPQSFYAQNSSAAFCATCPGWADSWDVEGIRAVAGWAVFWVVVVSMWLIQAIMERYRGVKEEAEEADKKM